MADNYLEKHQEDFERRKQRKLAERRRRLRKQLEEYRKKLRNDQNSQQDEQSTL